MISTICRLTPDLQPYASSSLHNTGAWCGYTSGPVQFSVGFTFLCLATWGWSCSTYSVRIVLCVSTVHPGILCTVDVCCWQKSLQNLEDACDELLMADDDTAVIPYLWHRSQLLSRFYIAHSFVGWWFCERFMASMPPDYIQWNK